MSQYKTFKTERLVIRPTLEQDANLIYQLISHKRKKMAEDKPRLARLSAIITQLQSKKIVTAKSIAEKHNVTVAVHPQL